VKIAIAEMHEHAATTGGMKPCKLQTSGAEWSNVEGAWAASLSHELKQPITAGIISVSTTLNCLRQNPPNLEKACQTATKAVKAGNRAAAIIDRLRSLYTKAPRYEMLDGNEIIRETLEMLRGQANRYRVSMDSGMGLAISRLIIQSHGGRLWATSNRGCGATFHFTMPIATQLLGRERATGT
jgi:signal transduction histidine kinase